MLRIARAGLCAPAMGSGAAAQCTRIAGAAVAAAAPAAAASSPFSGRSLHTTAMLLKRSQLELDAEAAGLIRRFKPTSPGIRHRVAVVHEHLWKGRPVKELTVGLKKSGGRNNTGRITVDSRGGGNRRLYRFVDFKRGAAVWDRPATVQRIEYDPNRNAHIALVQYESGTLSYILAPADLRAGDVVESSRTERLELKAGNCMPLGSMPIGTVVHNVELKPGKGGQLARAAGTSCTLVDKGGRPGMALMELASKEQRYIRLECMATIGTVSNPLAKLIKLGKAGRARWKGRRSHVRGCAMNPIDHPLGGGHSAKGRHPCSKTGVLAKGYKTRPKQKVHKFLVVPRGGILKGGAGKIETTA